MTESAKDWAKVTHNLRCRDCKAEILDSPWENCNSCPQCNSNKILYIPLENFEIGYYCLCSTYPRQIINLDTCPTCKSPYRSHFISWDLMCSQWGSIKKTAFIQEPNKVATAECWMQMLHQTGVSCSFCSFGPAITEIYLESMTQRQSRLHPHFTTTGSHTNDAITTLHSKRGRSRRKKPRVAFDEWETDISLDAATIQDFMNL